MESLGALAALAAAVLTVEQRGAASVFGLVLSYALQITQLTSMTVRPLSSCKTNPRLFALLVAIMHAVALWPEPL